MSLFYTPWKYQGFLMFSGSIEKQHGAVMGSMKYLEVVWRIFQSHWNNQYWKEIEGYNNLILLSAKYHLTDGRTFLKKVGNTKNFGKKINGFFPIGRDVSKWFLFRKVKKLLRCFSSFCINISQEVTISKPIGFLVFVYTSGKL